MLTHGYDANGTEELTFLGLLILLSGAAAAAVVICRLA